MKKIFQLLLFSLFVSDMYGQVNEDSLINYFDGKVFLVTLRAGKNAQNDSVFPPEFRKDISGSRVVLSFENGALEDSWAGQVKFSSCQPVIYTNTSNSTVFASWCSVEKTMVKAVWVGVIKKYKIQGSFSWVMPDGTMIKYVFMGSGKERERERNQL